METTDVPMVSNPDLDILDSPMSFHPGIRLTQALSPIASRSEEEGGPVQPGNFVHNNTTVLGKSFIALPLAEQWHALYLDSGNKIVRQSYNCIQGHLPDSFGEGKKDKGIIGDEDFLSIVTHTPAKGETILWGKEILLALPEHSVLGILFLGQPTARKRAKEFLHASCFPYPENEHRLRLVEVFSEHVKPAKLNYSWYESRCKPSNQDSPVPLNLAAFASEIAKFKPAMTEVEGDIPPER